MNVLKSGAVRRIILVVLAALALTLTTNVAANAANLYVQISGPSDRLLLDVEPSDSIENIKAKVQDAKGYPPARQHLFFNSVELDDRRTLADHNVQNNAVLTLTVDLSQGCTNLNNPAFDAAYNSADDLPGNPSRIGAYGPKEVAVFAATRTSGAATAPNGFVVAGLLQGADADFGARPLPAFIGGVSTLVFPFVGASDDGSNMGWYGSNVSWSVRCGADANANSIIDSEETPVLTPQTVMYTGPTTGVVGTPGTLSATGGASGNPVTFTVAPASAGVCEVSGTNNTTVTYKTAGTCVVKADQAGTEGTYSAATTVEATITVTAPGALSTGCTNLNSPVWDATYFSVNDVQGPSRFTTFGPKEVAIFTVTRTAGAATKPDGYAAITSYGLSPDRTPSDPPPTQTKEYFPDFSGGVSSLAVAFANSGSGAAEFYSVGWFSSNVSWSVRCGKDANGNKVIDSEEVTKIPVTITADNPSKTYGDVDPSSTYQVTGLEAGDNLTKVPACIRVPGENVGTKTVTCSGAEAAAKYEITYVAGSLTIAKRPVTVTPNGQSIMVDDALPASYPYTVTSGGLAFADAISGTCGVSGTPKDAGTYPITCPSLSAGSNYDLTVGAANLVIAKKAGVVTPDAKTITFGDEDPTFTYSISGVPDDYTLETPPICGVAGAHANAGQYTISCTGGADKNYDLTQTATAKLTVNKASVVVTANNASKIYGNPDPTFGSTTTGAGTVTGVNCGVSVAHTNAGEYTIECGGGTAGPNYEVTYDTGTLTVVKAALTLTADNKSRTTAQANPTLTYTSTGLVNDDTAATAFTGAPELSTSATAVSAPGSYPIGITAGTVSSTNYTVSYVPGTLTVTAVVSDTDGDGLTDVQERALGTNPAKADTDGDRLKDGAEVRGTTVTSKVRVRGRSFVAIGLVKTNPLKADSDGDGLSDGAEVSGYTLTTTVRTANGNYVIGFVATNPLKADTDGDGLKDKVEVTGSSNTRFGSKASNPNNWDTDNGGVADGLEIRYRTDPNTAGR